MKKLCLDCKTQVKSFYAKRCSSCAQKERFKDGAWNKGISNTWYNLAGLKAGWEAKEKLMEKRITKVCKCGKIFAVPTSLDRIKSCSSSCAKKGNTNHKGGYAAKGKDHYNWQGGITIEEKRQRVLFRRNIQKLIFERDNYTCQLCDSKKNLQVDHIQAWAEYIELRFSMDNCRTLCMKCHYKITFGKEMPNNIKVWGHNLNQVMKGGY